MSYGFCLITLLLYKINNSSMEHVYRSLIKILTLKKEQVPNYSLEFQGEPEAYIERMLLAHVGEEEKSEVTSKFVGYMSEHRGVKLMAEYFRNWEQVRFMTCHQFKTYHFNPEYRAFCVYGKAVSALKRKNKQAQNERNAIVAEVQNAMFMLNQQSLLPIAKNQSRDIDDILLHFNSPQQSADPIYLANQVFPHFVPQPYALIVILPIRFPRLQQLNNFLKGTLLHVFSQQANLLSRVVSRQIFYKNSVVRGIYFIEEGEVESTGGRIVARGWVSNGKCRSSGFGWKFKPLPFLKAIAKNQHIWKQFVNDLNLNREYPINVSNILGLQQEMVFDRIQKRGKKMLLPRIGHGSFDYGKLTQMQKVKHYDDRINQICDYKQKLLQKKGGGSSIYKPLARITDSMEDKSARRMLLKHTKSVSRSRLDSVSASSENILIMSVLKKLEALTQQTGRQEDGKDRRDKIKISPALLYEKTRIMKKKRYQ